MTCMEWSPRKNLQFPGHIVVDSPFAIANINTKQRSPLYFNVLEKLTIIAPIFPRKKKKALKNLCFLELSYIHRDLVPIYKIRGKIKELTDKVYINFS